LNLLYNAICSYFKEPSILFYKNCICLSQKLWYFDDNTFLYYIYSFVEQSNIRRYYTNVSRNRFKLCFDLIYYAINIINHGMRNLPIDFNVHVYYDNMYDFKRLLLLLLLRIVLSIIIRETRCMDSLITLINND